MRRHRSGPENITERGHEMQDNEDMAAGRLETDAELRKRKPALGGEPDPMRPAVDRIEQFLQEMSDEAKQQSSAFTFPKDAVNPKATSSARAASAQASDPMQPGIDALETWLQDRAVRADAPETEGDGIRAEALRRAKIRQTMSKPRGQPEASASPTAEDPLQPFLDSNMLLFSGDGEAGSDDGPRTPPEPGQAL